VSFEEYINLIRNYYSEIDGVLISDAKEKEKISNNYKPFIAFEEIINIINAKRQINLKVKY